MLAWLIGGILAPASAQSLAYDEQADPHAPALRACFQAQQHDPAGAAAQARGVLDAAPVQVQTQLRAWVCLGMAQGTLGQPALADQAATRVLALIDRHPLSPVERIRARMAAAGILQTIGQTPRANTVLEQALAEARADAPAQSQLIALDALALLHAADLGNHEVAEGYFRQALELAPGLAAENPMRDYGHALNLVQLGRFDEAADAFDRAASMADRAGPALEQLRYRIRSNRTDVLVARGQRVEARADLVASIDAQRRLRDVQGESVSQAKLGTLQLADGDSASALQAAEAALRLAEQGHFINEQREAATLAVAAHRARGDFARALDLAQGLYDRELARLRNQNLATLASLQAQLESQGQALQVERLEHQNQIQTLHLARATMLRNVAFAALVLVGVLGIVFASYQRRVNRRLRRWSALDPLTGVFNRREATRRLSAQAGGAARGVLFLIDADHFKAINDTHGHAAGDRVLIELARRLQTVCGDGAILARWGGEEFVMACPLQTHEQAMQMAERLRIAASTGSLPLSDAHERRISVSIGFAPVPFFPDSVDEGWQKVLRVADLALYVAKRSGRDAWAGVWGVRGGAAALRDVRRDPCRLEREGAIRLSGSRPMPWRTVDVAADPQAALDAAL